MQGPVYIFSLQSKDFRFWGINSSNDVVLSSNPYFIAFSPVGWEDIAIQNIRNRKYWGIDRTVTIPLTYVEDGARILKHITYSKGFEESVYLSISVLTVDYEPGVSYGYWYKQIYRGEINLPDFIHNSFKVTCTTVEDGLPKYLKANENTVYELPMNVPEAIKVKFDGIVLRQIAHFGITDGLPYTAHRFIANLPLLGTDGDNASGVLVSEINEDLPDTAGAELTFLQGSDNFFFKNDTADPIFITFSGVAKFKGRYINPLVPISFSLYVKQDRDNGGGAATANLLFTQALTLIETDYEVPFNVTVISFPGHEMYLVGNSSVNNDYQIEFLPDSILDAGFPTRYQTTYVNHLTGQYIFNQFVRKVTDTTYSAAASDYLTIHKDKVFTCGNAIRGLEDAVMKIKFSDFFKWWDSFNSVGLIDKGGRVDIAKKESLIDATTITDLPEPEYQTLKISVAKDYLFNEVEIGYPEIKNDIGVLNGNEEFNCKYLFSLGTVKNPSKIDKISPIKASCYEQEKIRITLLQKDTTDNKNDNDNYVNVINVTPVIGSGDIPTHYLLDRSLNSFITNGLLEPATVWNLPISTKRMINNNSSFFRSCTYKQETWNLKYQSSDKNNKLICNGVIEKADVNIGAMDSPFFTPFLIEGEFPAPDDILQLLDENPLRLYRFPVQGNYYIGIVNKISIAHSSRKTQQYQFLSVPENQLNKLIEYYG